MPLQVSETANGHVWWICSNQWTISAGLSQERAVRGPCTEDGAMIGAGSSDTLREAMLEMWGSLEDMETDVAMAHFIELVNEAQSFPGSIEAKEQRDMELYEQEQMAFEVYGKEDLVVTVKDHVQTIRFNRPTRRNALTLQMYNDIVEALAQAAVNDDIYLTVFTGSGEYYCSGNDLSNFDLANTSLSELVKVARSTLERFVAAFIDHPKPLVAAVNGPAIGIAVTTLALCDLVLASSDATFNTPFTSLGQSPEGCSSYLFPRIMGPAKANDVLLLGYKLTAEAALQYRLASRVMPASAFQRDYRSVLHWMTSLPQQSLQSSRSLIRSYDIDKLHQVNRLECDLLEKCWASQECHQALLEFSQRHKRKLQKRLEMLEGHDSRLVRDREIKLEKELEQHEQAEARLPPPDMAQQLHAGSSNADHAGGLDRITEGHSESSDNPK
ncbi:enoyl-CoA delta isomerase 3, peroxisomal-like isoform X2 [Sycon ciliatum]|uniref:enoyl-CoA delta isomerase 3, peroxisomal-like isoform X2 n=1 Tax=Sycon ciliatum TaxID=27933 RepID=UPI0031F6A0BA